MTKLANMIKPSAILLAIGGIAIVLLLLPTRTVSIDWGAGGGEWVYSAYANSHNSLCAQTNPNDRCGEWCEVGSSGQLEGTGHLCCMGQNGVCYAQNTFWP